MSDEPTERDVEALWRWFHNHGDGGVWETFDRPNSKVVARAVLASDWFAERIAQARREGAAEALKRAANRVAVATTPHSATFGPYMHASQIVRETALRGDA